MNKPIHVDLPHQLGRDEAKRRIAANIGSLEKHIPGGTQRVDTEWEGDTLKMSVQAMGQSVDTEILVEETRVRCELVLPGMLAMFAGPIEAVLQQKGSDLLLEDKRD